MFWGTQVTLRGDPVQCSTVCFLELTACSSGGPTEKHTVPNSDRLAALGAPREVASWAQDPAAQWGRAPVP